MHVRDVLLFTTNRPTASASLLQIIRFGGMHVRDVLLFTTNGATACHQVLQIIRFGGMHVGDVLLFTTDEATACHQVLHIYDSAACMSAMCYYLQQTRPPPVTKYCE